MISMITPNDFKLNEIMDDSIFWSLRHVLKDAKKHVVPYLKKNKPNAEFQVGIYNETIIIGNNTGVKSGYEAVQYDNKIEEAIKKSVEDNWLFQRTLVKRVIIAKPVNYSECYHAEMNIIRTVLQKIKDKASGFEKNDGELFIAGDKYPCTKCMEKIYTLNRDGIGIKILIPDYSLEYKGKKVFTQYDKNPVNWTDPL